MSYVPICAECVHLVGVRSRPEFAEGWKCGNPDNVESKSKNLVTGLEVISYKARTCAVARETETFCGLQGRWFQPYIPPAPTVSTARGKVLPSADDLLGELGQ